MKPGDTVRYIGQKHQFLKYNEDYLVYSVEVNGIRVHIPTGFVGTSIDNVILVKIGE